MAVAVIACVTVAPELIMNDVGYANVIPVPPSDKELVEKVRVPL